MSTQISERQMEIVTNILNQLGGKRFTMITGANMFVATENGVQFSVPSPKANKVKIELDVNDTYTVQFFLLNKRTGECKLVDETEGAYCDMLMDLFENATGLYCTLSPRH